MFYPWPQSFQVSISDHCPLLNIQIEKIFCVHGGISPELENMDNIRRLKRPMNIGGNGVEADLLWSDPSAEVCIGHIFAKLMQCLFRLMTGKQMKSAVSLICSEQSKSMNF